MIGRKPGVADQPSLIVDRVDRAQERLVSIDTQVMG